MTAQTKKELFGNVDLPITWLGIDFSNTTFVGDPESTTPSQMKDLFNKINILLTNEPEKYDIKGTFRKNYVESNITYTIEKNNNVDPDKIQSFNSKDAHKLTASKIQTLVNDYKFTGTDTGVGLIFIVDGLNKMDEQANIWVTFVNMSNNAVIFTECITGSAGGFGFRNHWAGAVHDVLKKIDTTLYKEWKKQYVPKE